MKTLALSVSLLLPTTLASQGPADTIVPPRDSSWAATPAPLSDLLMARVPGLRVSPSPGVGPAGARLRVRGAQTVLDAREPLVLVDGMRVAGSMSGWLVPSLLPGSPRVDDFRAWEVAEVTVVPGAAAAGIYGPDAANGVVLVRTRTGRNSAPQWQSFAGVGTTRPFAWPDGFAGYDADHADSLMRHGGCALFFVASGSCTQDSIGIRKPLLGNRQLAAAWQRQLGFSVGGGGNRVDYFAGWEFEGDGGVVALAPEEADRLRALGQPVRETTLDPDRRGRWTAVANVGVRPAESLELRARVARGWGESRVPPIALAFRGPRLCCDPDAPDSSAVLANEFIPTTTLGVARWTGALSGSWRPAHGLTVRGLVGYDGVEHDQVYVALPGEGLPVPGLPVDGYYLSQSRPDRTRTIDVSAEYGYRVSRRLTATSTIGMQHVRREREYLERAARGQVTDSSGPLNTRWVYEDRRDRGVVVRQQLDLDRRLSVAGVMRHDEFGFGPGALQPSVSASLLVGSEAAPWRLHGAYGTATRTPLFRDPEQTTEGTVGIAGSLGRGRATFDLAFYDMRSTAFVSTPYATSGSVNLSNRGVELSAQAKVLQTPRGSLALALGVWGNRNRVRSMTLAPFFAGTPLRAYIPGYPVGYQFAAGVPQYSDANGDGIITIGELIQTPDLQSVGAGTPYPTQGASLGMHASIGAWLSFGATVEYQAGHTLFNEPARIRCLQRVCQAAVDPATPLATQAEVAYLAATPMYYEDADFAKLRALSVTLSAPTRLAASLRLRAVALTVTGRNLITWTGYSGLDPEPVGRDPEVGEFETVSDAWAFPALPQWSIMVRLTY